MIGFLLIPTLVSAQEIDFTFYANGGTTSTSNFSIYEDYEFINYNGTSYSSYTEKSTIKNINSISGKTFTVTKKNDSLVTGKEWYFKNEYDGKTYYFNQNSTYKMSDVIAQLGIEDINFVSFSLYAYWNSRKKTGGIDVKAATTKKSTTETTKKNEKTKKNETTKKEASNEKHYVYIQYHINKGKLADKHSEEIVESEKFIYYNGQKNVQKITYNEKLGSAGLVDYNNPSFLNIQKAGYIAKKGAEWNTKADGTGKSYSQTKVYQASDFCDAKKKDCTVVLYLNWQKDEKNIKEVKVTYNSNKGKGCSGSFKIKADSSKKYKNYVNKLCEPTRDDYAFAGWFTDPENGEKITLNTKISTTTNQTLYAHWKTTRGTIYFLNTDEASESILIRSDDGHYAILDAALNSGTVCSNLVNNIKKIIKANGDPENIDFLIISHTHGDHTGCIENYLTKLNISKVILKGFTSARYKRPEIKKFETLNSNKYKKKIIDTLNQKTYKKGNNYITIPLGETKKTKIYIYNYTDTFNEAVNFDKKNSKNISTIHSTQWIAVTKSANFEKAASDGKGNYYYLDGYNSKYLKKAKKDTLIKMATENPYDANGMYRYYTINTKKRSSWNENTNALALLVEFSTTKGKRYAYLPSDLENNGVTATKENINNSKFKGSVTNFGGEYPLIVTNKGTLKYDSSNNLLNPVIKTTAKKLSDNTTGYTINEGAGKILYPAEAIVANQIKNNLGDKTKNILLYQPSHHGYNNDTYAVNKLCLNNTTTWFVVPNSNWPISFKLLHIQRTFFVTSKKVNESGHFTYTSENATGAYNAVVANFANDGTLDILGDSLSCSKIKGCKALK